MAITWQTPGAALVSAQNATSIAPAYPTGCVEGDKLLLVVGQRPSTVNSGSVSTPANWNLVAEKLAGGGYGTTFAADTANTNLRVYERTVPAGGLSGTLTVSVSTNNVCWAQILRLTTSNGSWDSVAGATGGDVTGGTAVSIACATNPGVTAGDAVLGAMCIPTDATTGTSGHGATQAGVTFGTWTRVAFVDSGTGNDIGGFVATALVSAGTATGNPTITATYAGTTTNVRGPGIFVRVREGALAARTGSMSFTETGTDTASASGDVIVQGSVAVAETGADTFAASGVVVSGVSGTMAVTEAGTDAFAASGKVLVKGALATSEPTADGFAALGQVFLSGLMSVAESGVDVAAFLGSVPANGTLSSLEVGQDSASATGGVLVNGSLVATEDGQDTFFATQVAVATGAMASTESGLDSAAVIGRVFTADVKRGGVSNASRKKAIKRLVYTVESDAEKREAVERILSEKDDQEPQSIATAGASSTAIPVLVEASRAIDLSPVIVGAARATADAVRAIVDDAIRREAERGAMEEARAMAVMQQAMQAAYFLRMRDEDEAESLIMIFASV